jgi:hypothetical protein
MTRRSAFLLSLAVAAAMVSILAVPADAQPPKGGGAGPRVNSGGGPTGGGGGGGGAAVPRGSAPSSPPPAPATSGGSGGHSSGGSWSSPPPSSSGGGATRRAPADSGSRTGQARSRSGDGTAVPDYSRPRGDRPAIGGAVPGYSRPRGNNPTTGSAVARPDDWSARNQTGISRGWGYYPGYWDGSYYYGSRYNYPWGLGMFGLGYFYYDPFYWNYWDRGYGYGYGGYGYGDEFLPGSTDDSGGLRLKVTPDTSQVYVDGYYAGTVDQFNSWYQKLSLQPGPHRIELRSEGFQTAIFEVNIRAGETITYKGDLAPLPKRIDKEPGQDPDPVIR